MAHAVRQVKASPGGGRLSQVVERPEKGETQARITDAACVIVVRDGYANLTLEAVAREAKVSKGGLLYHFPSKRALLEGMVEQRCNEFEEDVRKQLVNENGPGRWLRAMIRASSNRKQSYQQESAALFAVLANDRGLLEKIRGRRAKFKELIVDGDIDPIATSIVMLAIDGLCFNELMTMDGPRGAHRDQVINRLLEMAATESSPALATKGRSRTKAAAVKS